MSEAHPTSGTTTEANKQSSKRLGPEFSQGQHDKPPQLAGSSYREISIVRSATHLGSIIAGNCLCSGFICLCLWGFSTFEDISSWEKRVFNTLSLLLIAILGFGIGFLFDQIGLIARGTLLQRKSHSPKGIAYILRGTLLSYSSLLMHQARTRRGLTASTTWVLFLFLLCSLLGRFGVAFLGFAFNLEETSKYIPARFQPDWRNGTLEGDDSQKMALVSAMPVQSPPSQGRDFFTNPGMRDAIFEFAQSVKGLPWFLPRPEYYYLNTPATMTYAMNISHFSNANLTMEILDGNKVSFRYKFQDFQGLDAIPAGWEALLKTSCRRFESVDDMVIPLVTSNFTKYPASFGIPYRWIYREHVGRFYEDYSTQTPRNETIQIWLAGRSPEPLGPSEGKLAPQYMEDAYAGNKTILFNCSIYLVDSPTSGRSRSAFGVYDRPPWVREPRPDRDPSLGIHIIGQFIHALLRLSPVFPRTGITYGLDGKLENYRDFYRNPEFDYGISRKDQSTSELWLAAYIGNYIGNCLSFLNDYLRRVEIERAIPDTNTQLVVKWAQAATTLGALAALQVLFVLAAMFYCRRSFEIVDGVSTVSSKSTSFPFHSGRQAGPVYQAKFVTEGDRFRWVFIAGAEKNLKAGFV